MENGVHPPGFAPKKRAMLLGAILMLLAFRPAEATTLLVRVVELDRTTEYRLMTRKELKTMQERFRVQKKFFVRAKARARKEWESAPENGRFPSVSVGARSAYAIRSFRDERAAETARKAYAEQRTRTRRSGAARLRIREAAALVDEHLMALAGESFEDPGVEEQPKEEEPLHVRELLALHNDARALQKKPRIEMHPKLCAAAQKYAEFMARTGRYGHYENGDVRDRVTAEGYKGRAWGENIAQGHTTPRDVIAGWLGSPGHRKNILATWRHVGFGYAVSDHGTTYWVTVFAQ